MMHQGPGLDTERSCAPDQVREQLTLVLSSRMFCDSQRMSRFLQFVVERTLAGEGNTLKEYLIGVEVFDRKPSYDPRMDPIVRVEARRLRSKLKSYYESDGRADAIVIEFVKGSYAPQIRGVAVAATKTAPSEPAGLDPG